MYTLARYLYLFSNMHSISSKTDTTCIYAMFILYMYIFSKDITYIIIL